MKQLWFFSLIGLILFQQQMHAEVLLEGGGAYYYSTNSRFRDLYGGTGLYNAEVNVRAWKNLFSWTSVGYLYGHGDNNVGQHSHIHLVPVSTGLSYFFDYGICVPYIGLAPIFAFSSITNQSKSVTQHQIGWGGGGQAKVGVRIYCDSHFFVNLFSQYSFIFVDYHQNKKTVTIHRGDLSGLVFGGSFGYKF